MRIRLIAVGLMSCVVPLLAEPATGQSDAPYRGTFEYRYPPSFVLHVECHDDQHLSWTVQNGPSETVTVDRREIGPGIYLTSWTERSGAMVAQVANYNAKTLNSVLIVNGKRMVMQGTIERLTP